MELVMMLTAFGIGLFAGWIEMRKRYRKRIQQQREYIRLLQANENLLKKLLMRLDTTHAKV